MNTALETLSLIQDDVRWTLQELQHQDTLMLVGIVAGAIVLGQLLLTMWTLRRMRELTAMRERTSRLFDSLALLTDTTEAGLATVIQEISRVGKRPASSRRSPRSSVAKRVVEAAKKGADLSQIAEREALSEGEVHLHLKLAESGRMTRAAASAVGS